MEQTVSLSILIITCPIKKSYIHVAFFIHTPRPWPQFTSFIFAWPLASRSESSFRCNISTSPKTNWQWDKTSHNVKSVHFHSYSASRAPRYFLVSPRPLTWPESDPKSCHEAPSHEQSAHLRQLLQTKLPHGVQVQPEHFPLSTFIIIIKERLNKHHSFLEIVPINCVWLIWKNTSFRVRLAHKCTRIRAINLIIHTVINFPSIKNTSLNQYIILSRWMWFFLYFTQTVKSINYYLPNDWSHLLNSRLVFPSWIGACLIIDASIHWYWHVVDVDLFPRGLDPQNYVNLLRNTPEPQPRGSGVCQCCLFCSGFPYLPEACWLVL